MQKITPFLMVQRPGRRGDEFLRLDIQEFEARQSVGAMAKAARDRRARSCRRPSNSKASSSWRSTAARTSTFTPAISLFVNCKTQEEVDELWEKLSAGGEKSRCGWLKDKFGVSWQIIPTALGELLGDPDPAKSARVMQAMLQMTKIDIAGLKRSLRGTARGNTSGLQAPIESNSVFSTQTSSFSPMPRTDTFLTVMCILKKSTAAGSSTNMPRRLNANVVPGSFCRRDAMLMHEPT